MMEKQHKNIIEHNEEILREIRNRIMKKICSIIPTGLAAKQSRINVITEFEW